MVFSCWFIWRLITCSPLTLPWCFINTPQHLLSFSQKHYQTPAHNVSYDHSFLSHIQKSSSPQIRVSLISFKVIQILNSAASDEMLQIAFSFQNSVNVTYLRHYLTLSVYYKCSYKCSYDLILSKNLNNPNLYINWACMWYPDYQNKKLNLCIKWAILW